MIERVTSHTVLAVFHVYHHWYLLVLESRRSEPALRGKEYWRLRFYPGMLGVYRQRLSGQTGSGLIRGLRYHATWEGECT